MRPEKDENIDFPSHFRLFPPPAHPIIFCQPPSTFRWRKTLVKPLSSSTCPYVSHLQSRQFSLIELIGRQLSSSSSSVVASPAPFAAASSPDLLAPPPLPPPPTALGHIKGGGEEGREVVITPLLLRLDSWLDLAREGAKRHYSHSTFLPLLLLLRLSSPYIMIHAIKVPLFSPFSTGAENAFFSRRRIALVRD